jgi:hypothetical protein
VEFGTPGKIDFAVNSAPELAAINQFKSDSTTVISEGGTTNGKKVVFKAMVFDPEGEQAKLQIELRRLDDAYSGLVNSGTAAAVAAENLGAANYKWRFRVMDDHLLAGVWAQFSTPNNTDFVVTLETGISSDAKTSAPTSYRLLQNHPPIPSGVCLSMPARRSHKKFHKPGWC